ncbi:hypothetical protein AK812_SmicGene41987 [Symbiodinium microadriaticum]|uniref:Uncharacterized protein n=1 Tax=Symbiodinium microadriaticum TaxID=2951 RepID=A0A1Q9C4Q2_SYMMI|nr:hypothetical protein AK812_SmicGene41987 [Symbiodinium microadriaticum]
MSGEELKEIDLDAFFRPRTEAEKAQTPAKTFPDTAWNLPGVAESFPSPFTGRLTLLHRFDRRKAFEASGSRPLSSPGLSSSELASRLVLQAPPKGLFLEEAERLEMSALLARSDRPAVKVCPCQNVNACVRGVWFKRFRRSQWQEAV